MQLLDPGNSPWPGWDAKPLKTVAPRKACMGSFWKGSAIWVLYGFGVGDVPTPEWVVPIETWGVRVKAIIWRHIKQSLILAALLESVTVVRTATIVKRIHNSHNHNRSNKNNRHHPTTNQNKTDSNNYANNNINTETIGVAIAIVMNNNPDQNRPCCNRCFESRSSKFRASLNLKPLNP